MYTIHIKDVILYGKHGVYEEEQVIDAPFRISVDCVLQTTKSVQELVDTVNYANVFHIVKTVFATSYLLLEVLATEIVEKIKYQYPDIAQVTISIYKLNPLIEQFQGTVGITYTA